MRRTVVPFGNTERDVARKCWREIPRLEALLLHDCQLDFAWGVS